MRLQLARAFDLAPATWEVTLHESPPGDADIVVCGPDHDVPGSVRFDPEHPDRLVTAIAEVATQSSTRVIVVVGATGGCGATSVALHLAAAGNGCAVEADPGAIRRRLDIPHAKTWDPASDEAVELAAVPARPGLRVLLTSPEPDFVFNRAVDLVSDVFTNVIVDARRDQLDDVALRRPLGVLVLPPTRPGAERAREVLERDRGIRWAIVTNRLGPGSELTKQRIETMIMRRIAVELPCSPALRDSEDDGSLLTSPLSPWLWQIKRLWRALQTA